MFMEKIMNPTKLSNQEQRRFSDKLPLNRWFFWAKTLLFTIVVLNNGTDVVNAAPKALRPDIQVRNIMNTLSPSPSVRIAKDPRNNTLYYLKRNGEIYQVNLALSNSKLVYNSSNHNLSETEGIAIDSKGTIYLVGNADLANNQTKGIIVKGVINSITKQRIWSVLAKSAAYPKSNTAYDHRFNGVVVSLDGKFIYVNSGSRTSHGEIESVNGLYPNTREAGITACILRLPTSGQYIFLANNRATLKAKGYIFAEGTRNTFDMAFAPNGDLFGADNSSDSDMPEELNWLRLGNHYGFPWRLGGMDNPQQFANYNPANDKLLNPIFNAVKNGYYRNDPTFPPKPTNINFIEPIVNKGPDADSYRDPQTGQVRDASAIGRTISTFTPHRSPLGIVFDTQGAMSPEFNKDGFILGWTPGDPVGATLPGPFKDASQDLLHLNLTKIGTTNYQLQATRIVEGFSNPIDAEIIGNKIYVIEYGANEGIWEISMPTK
jgi:hypothetical protein